MYTLKPKSLERVCLALPTSNPSANLVSLPTVSIVPESEFSPPPPALRVRGEPQASPC